MYEVKYYFARVLDIWTRMSALYFKNTVRRAGAKRRGLKSSLLVVVVSECGHKSEDTLNTRKKNCTWKTTYYHLKLLRVWKRKIWYVFLNLSKRWVCFKLCWRAKGRYCFLSRFNIRKTWLKNCGSKALKVDEWKKTAMVVLATENCAIKPPLVWPPFV